MGRKRLGEILLEAGVVDAAALERALVHARNRGIRLGAALRELDLVPEARLVEALAAALNLPVADVGADDLDWEALHLLRPEFCERHVLLPYALEEGRGSRTLRVAMADPLDVPAIDEIEFTTGHRVRAAVAGQDAIRAAIARWLRRDRPRPEAGDGQVVLVRAGGVQEIYDPGPPEGVPVTLVDEVAVRAPPPAAPGRFDPPRPPPAPGPAPARAAPSNPRRSIAEDLAFLTGEAPDLEARVKRLEERQRTLLHLLAERGLLGVDELRRLLE